MEMKNKGINRIYQIKLVHEPVQQFLYLMCKAVRKEDMSYYQRRKLNETLCVTAERGHVEYITHFCRSTYPVLEVTNEKNQSLLHIAAESCHYNVYNIIYEFLRKQDKDDLDRSKYSLFQFEGLKKTMRFKDHLGNNVLHTVARITPLSQIDHIQGAVLQMQKELQWFKEVESIANLIDCESINIDTKTPRKIFTENHKNWGKRQKIVCALIITIMFVVAFNAPGGNEEKTGLTQFHMQSRFFLQHPRLSCFWAFSSHNLIIT
ncbi:hypothetical protein DVH24_028353 [Malus domestica]|uniref:PGG domain-containing protein n=1 Tax=Malus domestica TaxID=3750 RepID=A0A498H9U2_MALDO|nr:hypothetical protein DVH24_028353 [Malus domestica]